MTPRTHLLIRGKRAACRAAQFRRFTHNLRMVTCPDCQRSPHMAEAEIKAGHGNLTIKEQP